MDKLQQAVGELLIKFGSFESIMEAFGLANMPDAQKYGILFGFLTFTCTVSAVFCLLLFGGTFKRLAEQNQTGETTVLAAHDARNQRALLLDQLLDAREAMRRKYPATEITENRTPLTEMLLNVKPSPNSADYQNDYKLAYRICQDKPGGATLSGRPEARFEAYARGYAGCGNQITQVAYRRSYARMYESTCCKDHKTDEKYTKWFEERPEDIVGRTVRLEALEVKRHLEPLYHTTCGAASLEHNSYNPQEVWAFRIEGPFDSPKDMRQSFVFQHKMNEAAFAVVDSITEETLGAILLCNDDPENLSVQLEPPIVPPKLEESQKVLESYFLIIDRLFANGYRRIQMAIDTQDAQKRKLMLRLGFSFEGVLYKHMIVKESNRDSNLYSLLNSDWKKGARAALFKHLYGLAALKADSSNEKKEEEADEQQKQLAERKAQEELGSKKNK